MTNKEIESRFGYFQKQIDILNEKIISNKMIVSNDNIIVNCANCGNPIMINTEIHRRRREDARVFFCAVGHENYYNKK